MTAIRCSQCFRWLEPGEAAAPCPRCGSRERTAFDAEGAVAEEKSAVAKKLADKHYRAEAGLQKVIRLTGSAEAEVRPVEPIKLLEVNTNTVPSGVLPVSFGPAPASGIPYPSVIIEVSPEEFARIQSCELKLPNGWNLEEELPKPAETAGTG